MAPAWREACAQALARLCADAERLSGSRWHVFGDVAREGKVLYGGPLGGGTLLPAAVRSELPALLEAELEHCERAVAGLG